MRAAPRKFGGLLDPSRGCSNPAHNQRETTQAHAEADHSKAAAEHQAQQKATEAQNAAQQQATKEQQKADDKQNEAFSALTTQRDDYLSKVRVALDDLNGKISDLQTASAAETANGQKAEDSRVLNDLYARRDALRADAKSIPGATAMTWPGMKNQVDKDLDDSKSSARTASARIRSSPR